MRVALVSSFLLAVAACSAPDRHRPNLGEAEVVPLAHQPAQLIAGRVCGILHGAKVGSPEDRAGGCTSEAHANQHAAEGTVHVSLTTDTRTNSIVLAAPPGHAEDLARAIALIHSLDQPSTAAK